MLQNVLSHYRIITLFNFNRFIINFYRPEQEPNIWGVLNAFLQ